MRTWEKHATKVATLIRDCGCGVKVDQAIITKRTFSHRSVSPGLWVNRIPGDSTHSLMVKFGKPSHSGSSNSSCAIIRSTLDDVFGGRVFASNEE